MYSPTKNWFFACGIIKENILRPVTVSYMALNFPGYLLKLVGVTCKAACQISQFSENLKNP